MLVLLITGVPAVATFYTDWLWFKELGYEPVFLRSLSAQTLVAVAAGLVVFALLAGNLRSRCARCVRVRSSSTRSTGRRRS